jgi:hypothetical protein
LVLRLDDGLGCHDFRLGIGFAMRGLGDGSNRLCVAYVLFENHRFDVFFESVRFGMLGGNRFEVLFGSDRFDVFFRSDGIDVARECVGFDMLVGCSVLIEMWCRGHERKVVGNMLRLRRRRYERERIVVVLVVLVVLVVILDRRGLVYLFAVLFDRRRFVFDDVRLERRGRLRIRFRFQVRFRLEIGHGNERRARGGEMRFFATLAFRRALFEQLVRASLTFHEAFFRATLLIVERLLFQPFCLGAFRGIARFGLRRLTLLLCDLVLGQRRFYERSGRNERRHRGRLCVRVLIGVEIVATLRNQLLEE